MKRYLVTLWLSLLSLGAWAQATSAIDELLRTLQGVEQLQGRFEQRQYGENDVLLVESSGSFRLLRPGYFAWEIRSPDSQLILASPEYIWHYDRDLETVTRRPVTDTAQMSPLQVLGGDEAILRERFSVEQGAAGEFILTPLSSDAGFKRLTLQTQAAEISGMEILDNLNQRVAIDLIPAEGASRLTIDDFAFSPPDGVDLFYYDE